MDQLGAGSNPFDQFDIEDETPVPAGGSTAVSPTADFSSPLLPEPSKSENVFDQFDDRPDAAHPEKGGGWVDELVQGVSLNTAMEKTRALADSEKRGLDLGTPWADPAPEKPSANGEKPEPSLSAQYWEGLGPENIRAMADTFDHLALMSDDPSYQKFYADWAKSLRQAAASGASTKAVYEGFKDVHGLGDAWGYAREVIGRNLGMMTPSLVAATGGAALGSRAGAPMGKFGQMAGGIMGGVGGAMAGSAHLHISDMRNALMHEGVDGPLLAEYTNKGAIALASLDAFFPALTGLKLTGAGKIFRQRIASSVAQRLAKEGMMRTPAEFVRQFGSSILKEALLVEGSTEIAQEALTALGSKAIAGKEVTGEDYKKFATETAPEVLLQTVLTAGVISTPGSAMEAGGKIKEAKLQNTFPGDRPDINPQAGREQAHPQGLDSLSIQDILRNIEGESQADAPDDTTTPVASEEAMQQGTKATDLVQFLRNAGGLKPDAELGALDAKRWPGLISNKGLSIDKAREAMVEAGFLQEGSPDEPAITTPQDVYDLLGKALSGERIVPQADEQADRAFFADKTTREAEELLADMEATVVIPTIVEADVANGDSTISAAYAKLTKGERDEVIERVARGNENIDDLIEEMAIRSGGVDEIAGLAVRAGATPDEVGAIRKIAERNPKPIGRLVSALMHTARGATQAGAARPAAVHPGSLTQSQLTRMTGQQLIDEGARVGVVIPPNTTRGDAARLLRQAYADPGVQADEGAATLTADELRREGAGLATLTPGGYLEQLQIAREAAQNDGPAGAMHWRDEGRRLASLMGRMSKDNALTTASNFLGRTLTAQERSSRSTLAGAVARAFTEAAGVRVKTGAGLAPVTLTDPTLTPLASAREGRVQAALNRVAAKILPSSVQVKVVERIDIADAVRDAMLAVMRVKQKADANPSVAFTSRNGERWVATFTESTTGSNGSLDVEVVPEGGDPDNYVASVNLSFQGIGDPAIHGHERPRYEVGMVEVEKDFQRRGLANALYDAIEGHLGIKMQPSGLLYVDGYKFWKARDPEAVRGWILDPNEGDYISPLQIDLQIGFLKRFLADPRKNWSAGERAKMEDTLKRYQGLWKQVPKDLKERKALDRMFMLAGRKAATAPLGELAAAQAMANRGVKPEKIWRATGWAQGPVDGHWRFEIDDSEASISDVAWSKFTAPEKAKPVSRTEDRGIMSRLFGKKMASVIPSGPTQRVKTPDGKAMIVNIPLTELLSHPRLFAAYPFLRQMRVDLKLSDNERHGGWIESRHSGSTLRYKPIRINATSPAKAKSILLHELQHYIQNREGFAPGSTEVDRPNVFGDKHATRTKPILYNAEEGMRVGSQASTDFRWLRAMDSLSASRSEAEGHAVYLLGLYERHRLDQQALPTDKMGSQDASRLASSIQEEEERLEMSLRAGPDTYMNSFGEWEAREIQERAALSPSQRRARFPFAEVPANVMRGKATASYQEAYDEIMRRALVLRTMKEKWKERKDIGDGVYVVRAEEDMLLFGREGVDVTEEGFRWSSIVRAQLYPTIGGATIEFGGEFTRLPYAEQKSMMDAIGRDVRSRNMRPTTDGWQGEEAFEFWRRYDPAQVIQDPRLYRDQLEAAVKKEYGDDAKLVLYDDTDPATGEPYDGAYEPEYVYVAMPQGVPDFIGPLRREVARLRKESAAMDAGDLGEYNDGASAAIDRELVVAEGVLQSLSGVEDQAEFLRKEIAEFKAMQRDADDATWSELDDEIGFRRELLNRAEVAGVQTVPNYVIGDIVPQIDSSFSTGGVDRDTFRMAQVSAAMRERGIVGDGMLSVSSFRNRPSDRINFLYHRMLPLNLRVDKLMEESRDASDVRAEEISAEIDRINSEELRPMLDEIADLEDKQGAAQRKAFEEAGGNEIGENRLRLQAEVRALEGEMELLEGQETAPSDFKARRALSVVAERLRVKRAELEAVQLQADEVDRAVARATLMFGIDDSGDIRAALARGRLNPQATSEEQELLALGRANPRKELIEIALRANEIEAARTPGSNVVTTAVRTLFHEAVEIFNAVGLFTSREWGVMENAARKRGWVTPELRERYAAAYPDMLADQLEKLLLKEAIADNYADWHFSDAPAPKGVIGAAWQRVKDFLRQLAASLSPMGFTTPEDVFRKIDSGELARRYEAAFGSAQKSAQNADIAGVVRAGQLPDAPGFAPRTGVHPVIGLADIIHQFRHSLGMPVRQGRLDPGLRRAARQQGAQVYGQYNFGTGVTRLAVSNDFDSMTHEAGHHLEARYGAPMRALMNRYIHELGPLAAAINYQSTDAREGFAEFVRKYITAPSIAQQQAPGFFQAFETYLRIEDPQLIGELENIQQAYIGFLTGSPIEIGRANQTVLIGRDTAASRFLADVERDGLIDTTSDRLHWLYYATIGKNHGWWMATQRFLSLIERNTGRRIELTAEQNPNKLLRRMAHTTAWAQQALKQGMPLRATPNGSGHGLHEVLATAFGGTQASQWDQDALENFGDYLIARRAVHLFVRHEPALRQHVIQFVAANPQLQFLLQRLPNNAVSELERMPTLESLDVQLRKLVEHERQSPQYRQAAEMYYEFNRDIIRFLREKGLITQDQFNEYMQERDYAPFQRDFADREMAGDTRSSHRPEVNGPLSNKYGVYRAIRGSSRDIINPIQSTTQSVYEIMLRSGFNDTAQAMDRLSRAAGNGSGAIFERLPPQDARRIETHVRDLLMQAGRDAGLTPIDRAIMIANVESYLGPNATANMFSLQQTSERGERIIWFFEDGKPIPAQLSDGTLGAMMFEAFTTLGRRSPDMWMKMLAIPAAVTRFGVTSSFEFIFRNILVDAFVAPINSPHARPFLTQASGMREIARGGYYQQMYNRYGGMMGGAQTAALTDQSIDRDVMLLRNRGFKVRRPRTLVEWLKFPFQVGEFSETATRVGIFRNAMISAQRDGLSEQAAAIEAANAALDVMDFSRHGSRTELLRRVIPFFNASLQGVDKYIRSMSAQGDRGSAFGPWLNYRLNGQALTRAESRDLAQAQKAWIYTTLVFGGISLLCRALTGDDDDLEEIPQTLRSTHWIVNLNGVIHLLPKDWSALLPDDTNLRIPKGFETAWVANAVERTLDAWQKDDPTAFNNYVNDIWDTVKPPLNVPGLNLAYSLATGKDVDTGRDIIPSWEKDLERKEQYGPYTSGIGKAIGKTVNVSPYYVDYLARGLGASIARDVMTAGDMVSNWFGGTGPEVGIEEYPIARRFTYNVGKSSASVNKFYDLYRADESFNSWFWDTVSTDAKSYTAAGATYKALKKDADRTAAADDFYERINPDQKVYATLAVDFKGRSSKYRNLHPMEDAHDGVTVVNDLMKETIKGKVETGKKGEESVALTREQMHYIRNELGHIRKAITQNALHILGVPGWSNRAMVDLDARLKTLKAASEPVHDELVRRLEQKHFVHPKHLKKVWPEVRSRVLDQRGEADLGDLYSGGEIAAQ